MEYTYHCKKNGLDYIYATTFGTTLNSPADEYAWRRGVREYADNYHASVTKKDWKGTDEEFAAEIDKYCTEALTRFQNGDVPTERGAASSPDKAKIAKMYTMAKAAGVDPEKLLERYLEEMAEQGRAA
jgi:hypothetical protein